MPYLCHRNQTIELMKGRKYPLGLQTFERIIEENYIYVDKTELVYNLTHTNKYCFLSRPRRFGKSLLVTTLQAYFEGKKELFKGLAIDNLETEWISYPVLHFDLSYNKYYCIENLYSTLNTLIEDYEIAYNVERNTGASYSDRIKKVIAAAVKQTGRKVVILIDEYDAPMHDCMKDEKLQEQIRDTMRGFFSPLKAEERNLHFVFMTGISKFSQLSIFSELNNITNISMEDEYSSICGISKEELLEDFHEDIEDLAKAQKITFDEAVAELRFNYDGYHFSGKGADIFNPYSILHTFRRNDFDSYWFSTGTPTFLIELLKEKCIDMLQMEDIWTNSDRFDTPTKKITDPIPVLYQSGYLTIKDYNSFAKMYKLAFPNEEVRKGFSNSLFRYYAPDGMDDRDAIYMAWAKNFILSAEDNMDAFLPHLQTFYKKFPYTLVNNNERHYQAVLYTILLILGCDVTPEVPTSDGRIDMVLKTKRSIYVLELKYKKDAAVAMAQIDQKDYAAAFADDKRKKYKVGINFSEDRRNIDDWKVEAI